jgi:hypothetical protein
MTIVRQAKEWLMSPSVESYLAVFRVDIVALMEGGHVVSISDRHFRSSC